MFRRTSTHALALALVLPIVTAGAALGQSEDTPRLITQLRWVDVHLSSGRLRATSSYTGRRITASNKGSGRSEELTVDVSGGAVNLDYKLTSGEGNLTIAIAGGDEVHIRREQPGNPSLPPVEYLQPRSGPVVLIAPREGRAQEWEAPSLWHLLIAEPALCSQELMPLLRPLRPDWQLGAEAEQIEAALLRAAQALERPDHRSWRAWVADLASDEFRRRESADRQLRESGQSVLPYLRALDRTRLDAEQRFRIRRIVMALGGVAGFDTPESVVAWLSSDPETWLMLLASSDEARRRLAATQLSHAWGESIVFDPAADEQTRAQQLKQLRSKAD